MQLNACQLNREYIIKKNITSIHIGQKKISQDRKVILKQRTTTLNGHKKSSTASIKMQYHEMRVTPKYPDSGIISSEQNTFDGTELSFIEHQPGAE